MGAGGGSGLRAFATAVQLAALVHELYGLREEEIAIVERREDGERNEAYSKIEVTNQKRPEFARLFSLFAQVHAAAPEGLSAH